MSSAEYKEIFLLYKPQVVYLAIILKYKNIYIIKSFNFKNKNCILSQIDNYMISTTDEDRYYELAKFFDKLFGESLRFIFRLDDPTVNGEMQFHFEHLFIYSLFLYGGKEEEKMLIDYFWKRCYQPIACLMNAIYIFKKLSKFPFIQTKFIDTLKELEE